MQVSSRKPVIEKYMTQDNLVEQLTVAHNQLAKHATNVHKFGGSSLASTQCIERVVDIIRQHCQLNDIIVVSANGKTTDALFAIFQCAIEQSPELEEKITQLENMQSELINSLLNAASAARLQSYLTEDIKQMKAWLSDQPETHHADILAFGELWSARLLSSVLNERVCPAIFMDARDFLVIDNEQEYNVDYSVSRPGFEAKLHANHLTVVTGYICRDSQSVTRTLGRNGSDYSATIMAAISHANQVTLWTDVDGIYSADPRFVPQSRKLHRLPNGVAKELGRLGNPVLHANTLKPLADGKTHLHVASSFDPSVPGTEIGRFGQLAKQELSVTYLNDLILAQSQSFIGDLGREAGETFAALCADETQGLIVIRQEQQKAVSQWLAAHDTEVAFTPVSILATVGHKVTRQGNVKAKFKRTLRHQKVLAVVDAWSGHSVIAILSEPCSVELLNNVHHDMTKDAKHIGLVVAGLGNIGVKFLEMLPKQLARIPALENLHLVGLMTSKKALINTDGIDASHALSLFEQHAVSFDKALLSSWLKSHPYDELIVVDITPSEKFSQLYLEFFKEGIHVICANKWAASAPTPQYNELLAEAKANNSQWLGSTTVGAGLPINYAIQDLLKSGDQICEISGIFSGTLSWLFETYDGSVPFSTLLLDALEQGITEPDPREDLSGRDVQRKLLILARAAGFELSLEDVERQDLVPNELQAMTTEEFLANASQIDDFFATQLNEAKTSQACIRYIARFNVKDGKIKAKVSLECLSKNDAFATITPCDNIFQIRSLWYQENPLIIRGPGAGRDVTAGGLHSDLVTVCQNLANKQAVVKIKGLE